MDCGHKKIIGKSHDFAQKFYVHKQKRKRRMREKYKNSSSPIYTTISENDPTKMEQSTEKNWTQ